MKRGAPLQRRTPLKRTGFIRRMPKAERSSYARRDRFVTYMLWVTTLPCMVYEIGLETNGCRGHVQADHAGARPFGRKCSDWEVIPLCEAHHAQRPGLRGPWLGWGRARMRTWLDRAIARVQLLANWRHGPGSDVRPPPEVVQRAVDLLAA